MQLRDIPGHDVAPQSGNPQSLRSTHSVSSRTWARRVACNDAFTAIGLGDSCVVTGTRGKIGLHPCGDCATEAAVNDAKELPGRWSWDYRTRPPELRVNLIARPRLLHMLDEGVRGRLTLLHAPAGYGKTTLLAQWRETSVARGKAVAWLSFEEDGDDPTDLLRHLVGAFSVVPNLQLTNGGYRVSGDTRGMIAELAGRLANSGCVTLILDEYHLAGSQRVHDLVMQFVRAVPDNVRVVIASRFRGTFPISTLKARGNVQEIGPEHLRFTYEEAAAVFGASIAAESLQALFERTEGWPVALRLARHWIAGRAEADDLIRKFSGAAGDVAAYLTEQIMSGLPQPVQMFMLQTAIVDEINGDLADALRERSDGWQMLDGLKPLSAVLVPRPGGSGWCRYHPLFLDYLRGAQKSLGEVQLRQLHIRAAHWFAAHGRLETAVEHANEAHDYQLAAEMIERAGGGWIVQRSSASYLRRLLQSFPVAEIDARPRLRIVRGVLALKEGRPFDARRDIEDAREQAAALPFDVSFARDALGLLQAIAVLGDGGLTIEDVAALEALLGDTIRTDRLLRGTIQENLGIAHLRLGNVVATEAAAREALRIFEEFQAPNGRVFARIHLCMATLAQGRLRESDELLVELERLIKEFALTDATAAIVRTLRARVFYERGGLDAAWEAYHGSLEALEAGDSSFEVLDTSYGTAIEVLLAREDYDGALRVVERGNATARRRGLQRLENLLRYRQMEILTRQRKAAQESVEDVDALLANLESYRGRLVFLEQETATLAIARVAVAQHRGSTALELLQPLVAECERLGRMRSLIKGLLIEALAYQQLEKIDEAVAAVMRAVSLAAPECCARIFIEESQALTALLDEALRRVHISTLSAESIDLIASVLSAGLDRTLGHRIDLAALLKPREREVLEGIAEGLSNKMIARRMSLTDEAVKYHLKKLYAKLGVGDRELAASVARKYGLLRQPRRHE